MVIELPEVVLNPMVRGLCRKPYPNHPSGCPNFNSKVGCPPACPEFSLRPPYYAILNEFNLAEHVEQLRLKHPNWSYRQLSCCLYWQPAARKQLMEKCRVFLLEHPGFRIDTCPEAGGVSVTDTLRRVGIQLEWPPLNTVRQVALAGLKE